ncbi:MAG: purine-nucleoside phosphorylase [Rhizobiales bacterium]|nr:purine-nucleoside phosphorylase [Hyphomicrobiales bacterium]NRB15348.1 purine-nucleoside phosphorylase [Hyphomicrobiales bacterium]
MTEHIAQAKQIISAKIGDFSPDIGMILGSGLASLVDEVTDVTKIAYADLPGFPSHGAGAVTGHGTNLIIGMLGGQKVAILEGRKHYYEDGNPSAMRLPLEVLKAIGVSKMVVTNSAGSMDEKIKPANIMLINDHINYSGLNPLIGQTGDSRFVDMSDAYDPKLRKIMQQVAKENDIPLSQGVYVWYSGPSFETPAEIRALRILGGDAVGMSTVPEVILCRYLGLDVVGLSCLTNMAAGMSDTKLSHNQTKQVAAIGAKKIITLLTGFLQKL